MTVLVKILSSTIFSSLLCLLVQAQFNEHYEAVQPVCHGKCICQNESQSLLLNCTNRNMSYILNTWPPHGNYLTASFSYNNISELGQIPATDANISLSFSHCGIKTLASALFIDATGIRYLDLSWNLLTGSEIHSDVFRGRYSNRKFEPISLTSLDLSHNLIESLPNNIFGHTTDLKQLYLSGNPLKIIDSQSSHALSSVLKLEVLHLDNTSLKMLPNDLFSRLRKLREVDLSENEFERVPETLEHLSGSLQKLNLGGNLMTVLEDHNFMGLHELKELNISGLSELKTIRHNTFAFSPKLKVLHCENNRKLFHIHDNAFGKNEHIPSLEELYLSDCDLENLPDSLLHWSTLSVLSLSGNRWHCDCALFSTISIIHNDTSDILTPLASCSSPLTAVGTALNDLEGLQSACREHLEVKIVKRTGYLGVLQKIVLVSSVTLLTLVACFVFWRVVIRYNTIRSINTMFPVMYVSAPTTEN